VIIPSPSVTEKKGIYFGAEERELGPSSDRYGRIYRLAVSVLKKTYNLVISRRSRAGTAKECENLIINDCEFFERFQSL